MFYCKSSNYILTRSEKLMDAAEMIRGENLEISEGLKKLAEENQENLPTYLEAEGYDTVLKTFHKVLDFFEDELGRDDRIGRWLGGALVSIADITLGRSCRKVKRFSKNCGEI
jgi:glutathione S-transferase